MGMDKVAAIHQPNFFPWLGYFNKIAVADVFIILDNVQFPKKGGTWCNRVKLMVGGNPAWVTVPVERNYHGKRLIRDIKINNSVPWRGQLLKTIKTNYSRSPFYEEVIPLLADLIENQTNYLAEFNLNAIIAILERLKMDCGRIIVGSTLNVRGKATDLLIALVKQVGGKTYLSGGGAAGYQEDDKFAAAGLELRYQDFNHPTYLQRNGGEFVPGLSIIDLLMNCGLEEARGLISNA